MMNGESKMTCACPHHKVVPVSIILLGLLFLLGAMGVVTPGAVSVGWPLLVILIGVMKLTKGSCKCC